MKQLDPIKEVYDLYLDEEASCYNLITQVATLGLRLENELGVRGRECTID